MNVPVKAILRNGSIIVNDEKLYNKMGQKAYKELLQKLTLRKKQIIGPDKIARIFYRSDGKNLDDNKTISDAISASNVLLRPVKSKPFIHLPRFILSKLIASGIIGECNNTLKAGDNIPASHLNDELYTGELYNNQKIVIEKLMNEIYSVDNVNKGYSGCILNMRAGMGKTYVCVGIMDEIIKREKKKVLFVAPTEYLQKQTYDVLRHAFPTLHVGMYNQYTRKIRKRAHTYDVSKGGYFIDEQDVTVIIVDSAMIAANEFLARYDFIIFDEAHTYCSKERSKLLWKLPARYILGVTATPNHRTDGFDPISHKLIGDVIHSENIPGFVLDGVDFHGDVKVIRYKGSAEYTVPKINPFTNKTDTTKMIEQLISDPERNKMIVREIMELYEDPTREIFVFSERREHLRVLRDMLIAEVKREVAVIDGKQYADADNIPNDIYNGNEEQIQNFLDNLFAPELIDEENDEENNKNANENKNAEDNSKIMMGGATEDDIEKAKNSRIIFTTYNYSGTGVSIIKQNTAIFASPRRNGFEQIVARILRRGSDTNIARKVIDIVDVNTTLKGQLYGRTPAYDLYGLKINNVKK